MTSDEGAPPGVAPSRGDRPGLDRAASSVAVLGFSVSLGIGSVVIPLLALSAGYDAAVVGLLAATSAVTHLTARLQLPWLLGRVEDRWLIGGATLLLAISYGLLLVSTSLPVFLLSQLVSGAARASFWTGSQTHAVRQSESTVKALAIVNLLGSTGQVAGPAIGGLLAGISLPLAVAAGLVSGLVGSLAALGLLAMPTYDRTAAPRDGLLWRQPGIDAACWASFAGGGWRSLLGSYIPVVLTGAGHAPAFIGGLMSLADATGMIASGALVRFAHREIRTTMVLGVLAVGGAIALVPLVAEVPVAVAAALALGGVGSSLVTTLGPAVAATSGDRAHQGAAIALTGTFRALALFVVPAGIAAALVAVPLGVATAAAGLAIALPTLVVSRPGRHAAASSGVADN